MSQKPSVLVVDDESGILDTLRILLRNEGFEVTTAQGGKAGLEQIRSGAHDIILSDVRMPQVSGLDILQAAREQDAMTPVILMTAQAARGPVRIGVAIKSVSDGELPPGSEIERGARLIIRDNGPGIPDEIRSNLFDPFVSARPGGSGLGLAIVQRAVQAHRGLVLVDSARGAGTTFTIYLPATRVAEDVA